ncbi:MAG: hypothetical protein J6B97_04950 [Bacteroidales bacterium]|nr:hypothetical protein [Bacteroidales bacterium]
MADIKDIKKVLNFDFRATFYSQNAENLLDDKVVKANVARIHDITSKLENVDTEIEDASLIVEELRRSHKLGVSPQDVEITARSLRAVSYCIPSRDFHFSKFILEVIELHWTPILLRGLIHSLLREWTKFEIDIRIRLIDFITVKIKVINQEKYNKMLEYLNENGGYKLGYSMGSLRKNFYSCCEIFRLSNKRISYSYFSDVLCGYFETSPTPSIPEIEKILTAHNQAYTDKRVISRIIVKAWENKKLPSDLYDLAMRRIGDPAKESKWSVPEIATREERNIIENAKRIMQIAISSKFINVFFTNLCESSSRRQFWLEHVEKVDDFVVYGSSFSRNSISYKLEDRILNRYFRVVNSRHDNCALVLYSGDYAIIEFSGSGALYVYKKDSELYKRTLGKRVERLDDLKIGYLSNLVDNDYGQMYMRDEGRMVHIGNWQYRLDRWLRNKIQKR